MSESRVLQRTYSVAVYPDRGLILKRGDGVYLYDESGRRYLDLMTNYGVNIFGYNHPLLTGALTAQAETLPTLHGSFNNGVRARAAVSLVRRCGGGLARVHFANSGTEAVEAALKFAVLATGKKRFIACRRGFHGKTLGALSSSDNPFYTNPFRPLLWEFVLIDHNDLPQLEAALNDRTAAFLVEPVQGEGGVHTAAPGYLAGARELCRSSGALMVVDEIQTGMGRTGRFLASESEIRQQDLVCLGKGMAGGVPAGAVLVSPSVAGAIPRAIHTSTFGGNPLACAGINAVLELLDGDRLRHVDEIGAGFLAGLRRLPSPPLIAARGEGLMIGADFDGDRNTILRRLQEKGILAIPAGNTTVRFLPSYLLERDHVDRVCETLSGILRTL